MNISFKASALIAVLAAGAGAAPNPKQGFLMYKAVTSGNTAEVSALLDKGISPNEEFHGVLTPLNAAVSLGNADMANLLLERGAGLDYVSRYYQGGPGPTALSEAAAGGRTEIAKMLVDKGADIQKAIDGLEFKVNHGSGDEQSRNSCLVGIKFLRGLQGGPETVATVPAEHPVVSATAAPAPAAKQAVKILAPNYSNVPATDDYAVIVGIENYADLPAATYAERDAAAAKSFIRAMGVPERNIVLLTGNRATKTGMEKTLEAWLPNNVSEKSRVFVYYSGHGAPDTKTGDAYLVPSDGDPQYLTQTGYPLKRLYAKLEALKAKSVLVALDSCFSGAGGRSVLAKGTRPLVGKVDMAVQAEGKISVISASAGDQISGANEEAGYGLFTYNFLQGLNGAAKDAQGQVTLKSLYGYLKPRVQDEARRGNRDQVPQLQNGGEDLILRAK